MSALELDAHNQATEVEVSPLFDYLLHPPEGVKDVEAFVYEKYIGEKMTEMFGRYGYPKPEEYVQVTRTLRSVFGGQFFAEKRLWEELRGIKHSEADSNSE